jgi:hypothetical protein
MSKKKEQRAGLSTKVLQLKQYLDNHSIMTYNLNTR